MAPLDLHWLRPEMLWLAPLLLLVVALLMRGRWQGQRWQRHIDPQLLPYLLQTQTHPRPRRRLAGLLLAALLIQLALLGPSWQRAPVALYKNQASLVVVLDMSPSMLAGDIQPTRMARAKFKLRDLLQQRQDGQTGLVAFSGDAFVVAPLTDDNNTLLTLLPGLGPEMMPVIGSNPEAGLRKAIELLENGRGNGGHILLISDGVTDRQMPGVQSLLAEHSYSLSVLAVGTAAGAPIPLPDGGFARDSQGSIIVPKLTEQNLRRLAEQNGGRYETLTLSNDDLQSLLAVVDQATGDERKLKRQFDQWEDAGPWLVLLALPLALLCFRRSWLPVLLLTGLLSSHSSDLQAQTWANLWSTPDQRGAALLDESPAAAAEEFEDPMWQGTAHYRAGNYAAAAQAFAQKDSADAHYNRGNALAKAGDIEGAIAAYEEALERQPGMTDAIANKQLLEQQQKKPPQDKQQDDGKKNGKDGEKGNNKKENEQSQDQQSQGRQDQGQQDQNQQGQQGQQGDDSGQQRDKPGQASPDDQQDSSGQKNPGQSRGQQPQPGDQSQSSADEAQRQAEAAREHAQGGRPQEPKQQTAGQAGLQKGDEPGQQPTGAAASDEQLSEDQQAMEQWLRKIPDSPAGLLERKFQYQSQQRGNRQDIIEDDAYVPY